MAIDPVLALQQRTMAQAFANMPVPQVVFNGFEHNFSASEFTSTLAMGARPAIVLIMPPSVAKSFAISLLEMVERYETATGVKIDTIPDLTARIAAWSEEAGGSGDEK